MLQRREGSHDGWARPEVTNVFDVFELDLLLREHAPVNSALCTCDAICDLVGDVNIATLKYAKYPRCKARRPENAIITRCVLLVETGLDKEAVTRNGQSSTAARFRPNAISILRLSEGSAREHTRATNVRLVDDVENFQALLASHATDTAAAEAERHWRGAWSLEEANLP